MKYLLLLFLTVIVLPSYGYADPIGAEVVYVTGKVFREVPSGRVAVIKGDRFTEGEKIITENGQVEVRLDNGNMIKIDRNSELRIEALSRNKKGSTKSIFSLIFGRVKSKVFKLFDTASVFEYRTKAAVAGVAGTPPFVVEHSRTTNKTTVDLLGKKGEEGAVYVRGFDSAKTVVTILSGFSTSVLPGESPIDPYPTPKARFERLNKVIDFVTVIKQIRGGSDGLQLKSGFTARDIAINTVAKKVTVVAPTTADEEGSTKEADNRAEPNSPTAGVGSVNSSNSATGGGSSSGTPASPPPPPVTNTDVDVTVVIK